MAEPKQVTIEGATLIFRNFEGREGKFNESGKKRFAVLLDEETAAVLLADGWNVKRTKEREEGDGDDPYLEIKVSYVSRPPSVTLITSAGRTRLNEVSIGMLDWADIETVDLIFRGYDWDVSGKTGTAAYLKTMFVKIFEDDLELKYAELLADDEDEGGM